MSKDPAPAILFEDRHLLAVDKPAGILSVPPTTGGERNLSDQLRRALERRGERCFAVHRLDRDTSGVLLFAKTEAAKAALETAFKGRTIHKRYLAVVNHAPRSPRGTLRSFIADLGDVARSSKTRGDRAGREAVTEWRVLERFADAALIEALPRTGRFNQIRLHLVDLGCPIAGERKYAVASRLPLKARRVMLHAESLALAHPLDGSPLALVAPLPRDFEALLAQLRARR